MLNILARTEKEEAKILTNWWEIQEITLRTDNALYSFAKVNIKKPA